MPGLPLHPLVVHFPIALYLLGVLLTLSYFWRRNPEHERFAYLSFVLAWVGVIVAALTGLIDQGDLAPADPRRVSLNKHISTGLALLVVNGLLVYYRLRWADMLGSSRRWQYLALMAAGVLALVVTGWLGGELVYVLKVGID
jgi:uncharacterized membrane protein